jgi:hypothetical protein
VYSAHFSASRFGQAALQHVQNEASGTPKDGATGA